MKTILSAKPAVNELSFTTMKTYESLVTRTPIRKMSGMRHHSPLVSITSLPSSLISCTIMTYTSTDAKPQMNCCQKRRQLKLTLS